mgnify:CR=1 FL=1
MSEHYFTSSPTAAAQERPRSFLIRGREHAVTTAGAVFSPNHLDRGTQVLLDHVPDPPATGILLDLGCGWGPIALALADAAPDATVLAVDVNERAVDLAARNASAAGLGNIRALLADDLLAELRGSATVDLIWSNPPVRIGKEALHSLLLTWLALLSDNGEAWFVVQKNLGADSLMAWLNSQGWNTSREASSKGFRILHVHR